MGVGRFIIYCLCRIEYTHVKQNTKWHVEIYSLFFGFFWLLLLFVIFFSPPYPIISILFSHRGGGGGGGEDSVGKACFSLSLSPFPSPPEERKKGRSLLSFSLSRHSIYLSNKYTDRGGPVGVVIVNMNYTR